MTVYTFLYAAMLLAWPVYAIVSRICSCIETASLCRRKEEPEKDEEEPDDVDILEEEDDCDEICAE